MGGEGRVVVVVVPLNEDIRIWTLWLDDIETRNTLSAYNDQLCPHFIFLRFNKFSYLKSSV